INAVPWSVPVLECLQRCVSLSQLVQDCAAHRRWHCARRRRYLESDDHRLALTKTVPLCSPCDDLCTYKRCFSCNVSCQFQCRGRTECSFGFFGSRCIGSLAVHILPRYCAVSKYVLQSLRKQRRLAIAYHVAARA